MAGTLFVVATPIGNLEDVTLRALRVLRAVQVIAAEDTRRTARLLAHYGIATRTLSFHAHNSRSRIPKLLARLAAGEQVALVTDAGTPGISDPGTELVHACIHHGFAVDPVPGPSAPLAAAIASGFPLEPLTILGYPPTRSKDRTAWFLRLANVTHTITFFEAPHRIQQTLAEAEHFLVDRPIMVARELTKVHQEFLRADRPIDVVGLLTNHNGEFTLVVGPAAHAGHRSPPSSDSQIELEFGHMTENWALDRRKAIRTLARKYGRSSREVYMIIEKVRKSGL